MKQIVPVMRHILIDVECSSLFHCPAPEVAGSGTHEGVVRLFLNNLPAAPIRVTAHVLIDLAASQIAGGAPSRQSTMGVFSCFSRAKTTDATDGGDIMYSMDGMELKEGMSPGGSPGRNRRAAGSESLNGSPRKRIDYDALVKAKHMPGTNLHAVATANGAGSTQGNVELANARALVRALARKPESRQVSPAIPSRLGPTRYSMPM